MNRRMKKSCGEKRSSRYEGKKVFLRRWNGTGVTERAPGKAEDVCPPLARRVNMVGTMDPQSRKISTSDRIEENLTRENMSTRERRMATG